MQNDYILFPNQIVRYLFFRLGSSLILIFPEHLKRHTDRHPPLNQIV